MSTTLDELMAAADALSPVERLELVEHIRLQARHGSPGSGGARALASWAELQEQALRQIVAEDQRARETFERLTREVLRPEDDGRFVAIDPASGDYELGATPDEATSRLRARRPGSRVAMECAGQERLGKLHGRYLTRAKTPQ